MFVNHVQFQSLDVNIVFTMVVKFFSTNWEPKHVIIRLFEPHDMSGATMAMKLKQIVNKFSITQKIMAYVKDEGSNLQTCATTFNSIVSCHHLDMVEHAQSFEGMLICHFK
jgi:hypothetical protein